MVHKPNAHWYITIKIPHIKRKMQKEITFEEIFCHTNMATSTLRSINGTGYPFLIKVGEYRR
jgi:hypothetical protein